MRFGNLFLRIIIICAALFIAGIGTLVSAASDSAKAASGLTDFNSMKPSDFEEGMMVSGTVYEILDEFAYYETYEETFGYKHNERVTSHYYIVPMYGCEEPMYIGVELSNSELVSKANILCDQTWNYYDYGVEPEVWEEFFITGKVKPMEGELLDYFYEWFMYGDEESTRADYAPYICPYIITHYKVDTMPTRIIVGAVLTVIGLAGIVIFIILMVKPAAPKAAVPLYPTSDTAYTPVNASAASSGVVNSSGTVPSMTDEEKELMAAMDKIKQPENNADDFFSKPMKKTEPEPEKKEEAQPSYLTPGMDKDMDSIDTSALGIGIGDDE